MSEHLAPLLKPSSASVTTAKSTSIFLERAKKAGWLRISLPQSPIWQLAFLKATRKSSAVLGPVPSLMVRQVCQTFGGTETTVSPARKRDTPSSPPSLFQTASTCPSFISPYFMTFSFGLIVLRFLTAREFRGLAIIGHSQKISSSSWRIIKTFWL